MTNEQRLTAHEARLAKTRGYSIAHENVYAYRELTVNYKTNMENRIAVTVERTTTSDFTIKLIVDKNERRVDVMTFTAKTMAKAIKIADVALAAAVGTLNRTVVA